MPSNFILYIFLISFLFFSVEKDEFIASLLSSAKKKTIPFYDLGQINEADG